MDEAGVLARGQALLDAQSRALSSGFDPSTLPQLAMAPAAPPSDAAKHGLVYNALRAGWNEAQGLTDQAVAAGLKLAGADQASADWTKSAAEQDAEAARFRMNELEIAPWREGGSWANLPQQALYQALKQVPNVAAGLAGGALATAVAPEAFAGSAAAAGAGRLLGALGGEATAEAGAAALRQGVGAAATAYPQAVGSMYGEAVERGNPNASDAGKAMLMGVPYAALEAVEPTQLRGIFSKAGAHVAEKGLAGGIKATLADGAKALVNEAATEGAQTAMEQTFRPDLTLGQKANNVVDAMFLGGIAGGALGSVTSGAGRALRSTNMQPTAQVAQDPAQMTEVIDQTLNPQAAVAPAPSQPITDSTNVNSPAPPTGAAAADVLATPEIAGASAPAVEEPIYNPARPYQVLSDEQLTQRVQEAQPGSPQLTAISREIEARRQERANAAQAPQPDQLETDRANAQRAFTEQLRKDAGLTKQADKTLQRLGVADEASAVDAVTAVLQENPNPTKTVQKLAQYLGINPDGTLRDVASELEVAKDVQSQLRTEQQKAANAAQIAELERIQSVQGRVAQQREAAVQAAQAQEQARAEAAQLDIARVMTAKSLQSAAQEQTAGMAPDARKNFMAGLRAAVNAQAAPTRKDARAGYEFAQKYRDAQNLVERANESANAPEQPAQAVGLDGGLLQGNAAGAAQQSGPAPVQGQNAVPDEGQGQVGGSVEGGAVQGQGQGQNAVPNEGKISPAAEELLASVDAGGVPGMMTNRLRNIARENGIAVEPTTTPNVVIDRLRAMRDQPQAPRASALTPQAEQFLSDLDMSGPAGSWVARSPASPALKKLARDNGVSDAPSMAAPIIAALRAKRGAPATGAVPTARAPQNQTQATPAATEVVPESRPSASAQQAAATPAPASAPQTRSAPRSAPETVQAVDQEVRNATQTVAAAEAATQRAPNSDPTGPRTTTWGERFLRQHLGWTTMFHIAQHFKDYMPQLMRFVEAQQTRQNISQRWSSVAMQAWYTLEKLPRTVQESVGKLMAVATELRLDPAKAWEEHKHILNKDVPLQRQQQLKQEYDKLRQQYRGLQGNGGAKAFQQFRAINEADRHAHHAVALQRALQTDPAVPPALKSRVPDPMADFMQQADIADTPEKVGKFWKREADKVLGVAKEWLDQERAALRNPKLDPDERLRRQDSIGVVKKLTDQIFAERNHMEQAPYFHLGRFGDYAVAFKIQPLADGSLEPANIQRIQDRLTAGNFPAVISAATDKSQVFIRVETADQMNSLRTLVDQMAGEGWVQKGSVLSDVLTKIDPRMTSNSEKLMQRMIEEVRASGLWDTGDPEVADQREKMEKFIRQFTIDMMPDMSLGRVMTPRKNIPGYSPDMLRSFAHRVGVGGQSLARLSGTAEVLDVLSEMRQEVQKAKTDGDVTLMKNLYNEAARREYLRSISSGGSMMETLKSLNYTYFMGFNPSHAALQFMQVPVLLLPELAKRANVGFMRASKAIAGSTTPAFKIMAAVIQQGAEQGLARAASAVITPSALEKAMPGEANRGRREFLMRVVNSGAIDTGSEARELGRAAEAKSDSKLDKYARYANALGYYSETTSRLIAALASYELNQGKGSEYQFHDAIATVDQAMFNFANYNTARMMGRNGFLGPATPLVTAFMSYNAQLMEKLYRETYKAVGAGKTSKEDAAEARRFLLYHAGAVTAVAGTMGLPFASAFAVAFDKLKDLADPEDEPFDSRAAFRNWMNLTFGQTAGDVLARGLPRLLGTDVSDRAGEANLLPFSQFLADRGSFRDAFGRMEQRGFGSPASAMQNILGAIDQFDAGDYFGATRAFMPQGVKNMMDAYRMESDGYVDAKGHKLPLSVGAEDELRKALGFKGDREADFSEVKAINDREKRTLQQEAGPIMKNLIESLRKGDMDTARDYFARAQEYDARHPDQAILPKLMGRFSASARNEALESITGMPAGIKLDNQKLMNDLQWYQGRSR